MHLSRRVRPLFHLVQQQQTLTCICLTSDEEIVEAFHARFEEAIKYNKDMKPFLGKAQEDLNPLRVLGLFERIPDHHCELLDFHPVRHAASLTPETNLRSPFLTFAQDTGRPELMILTHVLVPPVCIRPSVIMDAGQGSNEDDLTIKLTEIIHMNKLIEGYMKKGSAMNIVMEDWDFLQIQCALYINSETPGMPTSITRGKPTRGFCQRLKGLLSSTDFRQNRSLPRQSVRKACGFFIAYCHFTGPQPLH